MNILDILLIVFFPVLFVGSIYIGWSIGQIAAKIFFAILDLIDVFREMVSKVV